MAAEQGKASDSDGRGRLRVAITSKISQQSTKQCSNSLRDIHTARRIPHTLRTPAVDISAE